MPRQTNTTKTHGFTLVEVLIIAPIVVLLIGGFVGLMINMVGDVLLTRDQSVMSYDIQDALDRIEQDARLSTQFLTTTNALTAPQGSDSNFTGSAAFTNTSNLVMGALTTDKNPADTTRGIIYYAKQPNDCGTSQTYNRVFLQKIIYFLKDGSLWRRAVLAPYNTSVTVTDETVCAAPWQQNTCSPGYSLATRCETNDTELVKNVDSFSIKYFDSPSSTTDLGAANALIATSIEVTINSTKTTVGKSITNNGSIRATKLNNIDVDPPTPATPTVVAEQSTPETVKFSWDAIPSTASYLISYTINGGSPITATVNAATYDYTVTAARKDTITMQVAAKNSTGTSAYGSASSTLPEWTVCPFQNNGWANFGFGYSTNSFTKTSDGTVMLKGVVAGGAQGTTVCILPVGFRPTKDLIFQTASNNNASRIDVTANGLVFATTSNPTWLVLDGINFVASTAPYTWTTANKVNNWVDFGNPYAPLQSTKDSLGRVHTQGVVKSGTYSPDGTNVANNMPVAQRTAQYMTFPAASNSAFNYMGVGTSGSLDARGINSSGYYSLQTMFYPSGSPGWTDLTLQSGWVPFNPGFASPQYIKLSDGMVMVKGMIKSGLTATDTIIARLPVGYRPKEILVIHGAAWGAYSRLDVNPDGYIRVVNAHSGWTSMDAISFMAEQ